MAVNFEIDTACGFRQMTIDDMPRILVIERAVYTHPWSVGIFTDCLKVGYSCWVFEERDELLAYGLISVAANEAHILNICVSPNAQGKGLGKRMLYRLIRSAEERGAESIFLEVRASNIIAQNLYEQEGFNRLGVRPAYYPSSDGREDALVFAKAINLLNSYGFKEN